METIPWRVYNSVGAVYPYLDREQKNRALKQVLNILDGLRSSYVNGAEGIGHTTGIREPLLLTDIVLVRGHYLPGIGESRNIVRQFPNFYEFRKGVMNEQGEFYVGQVKNDFLMSFTLLNSKYCDYGEDYANFALEHTPEFLDRVLNGIAAIIYKRGPNPDGEKNDVLPLPKKLHERIKQFGQKRDWVDHTLPMFK